MCAKVKWKTKHNFQNFQIAWSILTYHMVKTLVEIKVTTFSQDYEDH